jgi:aryl-alcohol dehydrogenase-like predicted oxidoreductase
MRQRSFGKTQLRVSELCLGTMAFGAGIEASESRRILDAFLDAGGTFVDAANTFGAGEGERILGEALRGRRDRIRIGTKFGRSTNPKDPAACGNRRENLQRSLDESLARLGTDHVDVLWAHAWDPSTPADELALGFEEAVRSGKALSVGIADAPAWGIARVHTFAEQHGMRVDGLILEYGLAARDAERELLPMADALGLTPLAWGMLSGDLLIGDSESVRKRQESSGDYYARLRGAAAARISRSLQVVADERGASAAAVAIAWVRAAQPSVIPVLGPKTEVELRDRLTALDLALDARELALLDDWSRIDLGFPSEYLRDPGVKKEIYGDAGESDRSTP